MTRVVTYAHAYHDGRAIDLCDDCAARPVDSFGPLGPVQRGAHQGWCDQCEPDDWARELRAAEGDDGQRDA